MANRTPGFQPSTGGSPGRASRRLKTAAVIVGVWALVSLLAASQSYLASSYLANRSLGDEPQWGALLAQQLPAYLVWILLTPLVLVVARRFPLERGDLGRHVPVHVFAAGACGLLYVFAWMQWSWRVGGYSVDVSTSDVFWAFFRARFNIAFLIYWAIVGVDHAIANYRRYREGEVEASRARAELARTQLRALKMQLRPHFLFNTLHAVASLMDDDVKAARRVLARLSELLRATLESEGVQEQPLEAELDILRRYVEIEEIRFGDRLAVEWEVEEGTADALVPPFLMQPLVENAIRHGVEPSAERGSVRVRARRGDGRLTLAVEDDGPGLSREGSVNGGTGIGLSNTRARLTQLYPDDHRFQLAESARGGLRVEIEIPYRREPVGDVDSALADSDHSPDAG